MVDSSESGGGVAERIHVEGILLPLAFSVIKTIVIVGIIYVEFGRADSNNRSWVTWLSGVAAAHTSRRQFS